ncbi:phosphopantetheine-binding protein [Ascidiimonas sp. W6]|uniref:phosphopantetheine-binding protein n=1 Tax=Ascidiimonas meishanensis TaxID=3128903 RepID=UPI0030EEDBAA
MNEEHYQKLKEIIQIYLPEDVSVEAITPESNLVTELNINSANLVDIILDVEDSFDIMIEDADMDQMQTVKNALDIVEKKLAEK